MTMDDQSLTSLTHRYRNNAKAVEVGNPAWQAAADIRSFCETVREFVDVESPELVGVPA